MYMFKRITIILFIVLFCNRHNNLFSAEFDLIGKIESIRKNKIVTIIFDKKPSGEHYLIFENDLIIGNITILNISTYTKNQKLIYRALAEYNPREYRNVIKAGYNIGLLKEEGKEEVQIPKDEKIKEKDKYKQFIITDIDLREMILIPEGKFLFGADTGDKDEQPQQIIYLDNFYIDKYEVSNSDYKIFVNKTNSKPPVSWTNGIYKEGEDDFPVMVAYYEAIKYAEWAGKRIPLEEEWEKSARGSGLEIVKNQDETYAAIEKPVIYPWGNKFEPSKLNSLEFWDTKNTGEDIKKKYKRGLLPIYCFKDSGDSIYGIVNMSGNAAEWTASWYNAYKGSKYSDKMFGNQVKVIRGGAWYQSKYKQRTSDREIGGLPNLYDDNLAGFRCVKDPTIIDKIQTKPE